MTVVMEAFDGCVLDRSVYPLALAVGRGMVRLGEAMLDVAGLVDHVEAHLPGEGGVPVARLNGVLDAVVGEDRVDPVGNGFEQAFQELPCRLPVSLFYKLGDGELAGAIDGYEQVELVRESQGGQAAAEGAVLSDLRKTILRNMDVYFGALNVPYGVFRIDHF